MGRELPGGVLQLDPERHLVRETELARYLQKHLNEPRFMTYFHAKEKTWVVAVWQNRGRGWVRELVALPSLGAFTREHRQGIEQWYHNQTMTYKQIRRQMASEEHAELVEWDEDMKEGLALKKSLARKAGGVMSDHPWFDRSDLGYCG